MITFSLYEILFFYFYFKKNISLSMFRDFVKKRIKVRITQIIVLKFL